MTPIVRLEPRRGVRPQGRELDPVEDPEEEAQLRARPAPCKVLRSHEDAEDRRSSSSVAPTKLTRFQDGTAMPPAEALRYASWVGRLGERQAQQAASMQVSRRATATGAHLEEEGALASAFAFLDDQAPPSGEPAAALFAPRPAARAAGQALPDELARRLSEELQLDVSATRLHTDDRAARAAAALGARAFTIDHHVFFAAGAYAPESEEGLELLAHEVAHVAQNLRGKISAGGRRMSRPDDAHERHADDFARTFARRVHRPAASSDPADLVEDVRARGQRTQLPDLPELEHKLGSRLDFVEAYTGEAAQRACQLLSAGAFAVRNIVAFAEPSPRRDTLLHELTHIVQMGAATQGTPATFRTGSLRVSSPGDAAEVEARGVVQGGARISERAEPDVLHRTDPEESSWNITDARVRFETWIASRKEVFPENKTRIFGKLPPSTVRYRHTSTGYFRRSDYAEVFTGTTGIPQWRKDTELATLWQENIAGLGLAKLGNGSLFAWVNPDELGTDRHVAYLADEERRSPQQRYDDYLDILSEIRTRGHNVQPAAVTFESDGALCNFLEEEAGASKPRNEDELRQCRYSLVNAFATCETLQWDGAGLPGWQVFFRDVIKSRIFAGGYNRIQGEIFAIIAATDLSTWGADLSLGETHFVHPSFHTTSHERLADAILNSDQIEERGIVDFKAVSLSPDTPMIEAAQDYALICEQQLLGYHTEHPEEVNERYEVGPFNKVMYVFPTAEIAASWADTLRAHIPAERLIIYPDPEGSEVGGVDVTMNPTFNIPLSDATTTSHVISSPPILHSGITISEVTITTSAPGSTEVVSGSATLDFDLGGALSAQDVTKPMTASGGNQAHIENRWAGLTGELTDLLQGAQVEARVTDEGVAGSITVTPNTQLGAVTITGGEVTFSYSADALAVTGSLDLSFGEGAVTGSLTIGWESGGWTFTGTVDFPANMIDGLSAFSATLGYGAGEWRLGVDEVSYTRELGAITLTGTATGLELNMTTGMFSGLLGFEADLGLFGTASGRAELQDNALSAAELSYDSPEFRYPADSEPPSFTGTIGGTLTYEDGRISGEVRGTAGIAIPALQSLLGEGGLGLVLEGAIDADGNYSGTIGTSTAIRLGEYFEIPEGASLTITSAGELEGDLALRVVNILHLESAELGLHIDRNGVTVSSAAAEVSFGAEADRLHGTLSVGYAAETGLTIGGELTARIRDGMVATGTLSYTSADNQLDVSLTVEEITLLEYGPEARTLFEMQRQVPLLNVYGLGVYLDIGFDLGFSYQFDLRLQPTVTLEGFSLSTFEYTQAQAEIELRGELVAQLTATPRIGLGLFALSPSLLRGGGGVLIPIVGEARLLPSGTVTVGYSPDGGVTGDAQLGMSLTFGIQGSVRPYAELSLLDGVWEPSWTGDALTEFEIMPPKELFNYQLDLGGDLTQQDPELPETLAAPQAASGAQLAEEEVMTADSGDAAASGDTEVPTAGPGEGSGELPSEPVNLGGLSSGLQGLPGYQTITSAMSRAGQLWESVGDFFARVADVLADFFASLADGIAEIVDGFIAHGVDYLPQLLRRVVGEDAWYIIEPIVTAITESMEGLLGLLEASPPSGISDFFPWALGLMASAWDLSFGSLDTLVSALNTMMSRLGEVAGSLVTQMVERGMIGVKRHVYYIGIDQDFFGLGRPAHYFFVANQYKIHLLGVDIDYHDTGAVLSPTSGVAIALFEVLEHLGVAPTTDARDDRVGEAYGDRWVD